jgi:hypothetical protein
VRPYRQLSTSLARTAASLMSIVDVLGRGEQGPRMRDEACVNCRGDDRQSRSGRGSPSTAILYQWVVVIERTELHRRVPAGAPWLLEGRGYVRVYPDDVVEPSGGPPDQCQY